MNKKIIALVGLALLANACSPKSNNRDESPAPAAAVEKAPTKGKPAPAAKGKPAAKPASKPTAPTPEAPVPVVAEAPEVVEVKTPQTFPEYSKELEAKNETEKRVIYGSWHSQQEMDFPGVLQSGDPWASEPFLEVSLCSITKAGTAHEKEACTTLGEINSPNNDMRADVKVVQIDSNYEVSIKDISDKSKRIEKSSTYRLKFTYLRMTGKSSTALSNAQVAASGFIPLNDVVKYTSSGDELRVLLYPTQGEKRPVGVVTVSIGTAL